MNKYTKLIKEKGYTLEECKRLWHYSDGSWHRHITNSKYHNRLKCLINGLPKKDN